MGDKDLNGTLKYSKGKTDIDIEEGNNKAWYRESSEEMKFGVSKDGAGVSYSTKSGLDIATGANISYSRDGLEVTTPLDDARKGSRGKERRSEVYVRDDIEGPVGGFKTRNNEGNLRYNRIKDKYEAKIGNRDSKGPSAKFVVGEGHEEANVKVGETEISYKKGLKGENFRVTYGDRGLELSEDGKLRVITGAEVSTKRSSRNERDSGKRRSRTERYSDDE